MERVFVSSLDPIETRDIERVSTLLDAAKNHTLRYAPWTAFPYKPHVRFSMAHAETSVLLKFYVQETSIRAAVTDVNGSVWEDSCVEFFIAFDTQGYYNFEFNCIGTAMVAWGPCRTQRQCLPVNLIKKITSQSSIRRSDDLYEWELTIIIPVSLFIHHGGTSLPGKACRGNFCKCGDALPQPHFICWSNIHSEEPNFHLQEFFSEIVFD